MPIQRFTWRGRDAAARDLMQLVQYGPQFVRDKALELLQSIRSLEIVPELKAIALDADWSFNERGHALQALAALPGDIAFPEFEAVFEVYANGRFLELDKAWHSLNDSITADLLNDERRMVGTLFYVVGRHPSNLGWFYRQLDQSSPATQAAILVNAIGAVCQQPLEPVLIQRLTTLLDKHPELITLDILSEIAGHDDDEPPKWLTENFDTVLRFLVAEPEKASNVLSFSPVLTQRVAETHPELAKANLSYAYLIAPESVPNIPTEPSIQSSPLWLDVEAIYQKAVNGDDSAFSMLFEFPDEGEHIPLQATMTHFLGKLIDHELVFDRLYDLAISANDSWGDYGSEHPVRYEAAEAMRLTGSERAWQALIDIHFANHRHSLFHKTLEWVDELTDILSKRREPHPPASIDQFPIEQRRWFKAVATEPRRLDQIHAKPVLNVMRAKDTTLYIREVDRANWRDALKLSVLPHQQRFIADYAPIAAIALAKAHIRPGDKLWIPYAIYADEQMIGLVELACTPDTSDDYWIYHFFIDQAWQGKDFGKAAMNSFVAHVKTQFPHCQQINLTVHPENFLAQHVYRLAGFRETSKFINGESVYSLQLSN